MGWHIQCKPEDISRYVFCPGDQARARKIADQMEEPHLSFEGRGYVVFTGAVKQIPMTVCGTGMGGPVVAIALEELAQMGADTFIRVGSCGVFQEGQQPGDMIIPGGTIRGGGTGNAYLPLQFPAVPTFSILSALTGSADELAIPYTVGIGVSVDAFYGPSDEDFQTQYLRVGAVSIEMECDTLFILGAYHRWRTGAILTSDGIPGEIKPEWGEEAFRQGEKNAIQVALNAMWHLAQADMKNG